ncbi:MAG: DUF6020 family protein [Eubacteriales bacterium]|nr:DUF6020 family protein [Eubacteriales bacterium]
MDRRRLNGVKNWACAALACFAVMAAMNTDLSGVTAEGGSLWGVLAANIKKLEYLLPTFSYREALLAFFILFFFLRVQERWPEGISRMAVRIPAALISFFLVFGFSFRHTNSWDLVFMDSFHLLASALQMAGFYALAVRLIQLLAGYLTELASGQERPAGRAVRWIFERHPFAGPFLIILLFWLPYIAAKYPGAAMPETLAEMRQYYWGTINNYYPPLHTILQGLVMEFGNALASYSFGFFLNLALQLALLLSAFSYGFVLMKRWRTPYVFRVFGLAIICIVQFFPMESTVVEKDVPYTACVLFFVLLLTETMRTLRSERKLSWKRMAGFVLACLGTAGFRNEGIYLVLAGALPMCVYAWRLVGRDNRGKGARILAALLVPVALVVGYQKILLPACGVEDNGLREVLSIPFQQTARYVRDYGDEVTEEEAEKIGRVLDYENLAELYDPVTSDPVKYTYHAENMQELADYFGVWLAQLLKHPGNAVEATMNNVYGWFYQEGYAHNYMMTSTIEGQEVRWEIVQPEKLAGVRQVMERVAKLLSRVPVLNWFENAGIVSWLTILLASVWIGAGKKRYLIPLAPLLTAILVCIAGPTFNYQMRYIMPVMFCVPFYGGMLTLSLRE